MLLGWHIQYQSVFDGGLLMVEDMATNLTPRRKGSHATQQTFATKLRVRVVVEARAKEMKFTNRATFFGTTAFRDTPARSSSSRTVAMRACVKASLLRSPTRRTQEQCASTPEGERDHLRTPSKTRFQKSRILLTNDEYIILTRFTAITGALIIIFFRLTAIKTVARVCLNAQCQREGSMRGSFPKKKKTHRHWTAISIFNCILYNKNAQKIKLKKEAPQGRNTSRISVKVKTALA